MRELNFGTLLARAVTDVFAIIDFVRYGARRGNRHPAPQEGLGEKNTVALLLVFAQYHAQILLKTLTCAQVFKRRCADCSKTRPPAIA